MDTEMKKAVVATAGETQYDTHAKRILAQKIVLANILAKTVDEFIGMDPTDIVPLIEGEPCVGVVPTDSGLTNTKDKTDRIVGLNTEATEINEGVIRFDIVFYVRMRDGLTKMIINIEAQKDNPSSYSILNRAIVYICRLISSQLGRDFTNSNYDDAKRVVSIWICTNMEENTLNQYCLEDKKLIGNHVWPGDLDLLNIVIIGLSDKIPESGDTRYELHRFLGVLLSMCLNETEKTSILEEEFDIPMNQEMKEEVTVMCNLGEGIRERALAEGMTRGIEEGMTRGIAEGMTRGIKEGMTRGITEGRLTERMQAIQNMLEFGVDEACILEKYTKEELQKAKSA